jgi:hypothetical protein
MICGGRRQLFYWSQGSRVLKTMWIGYVQGHIEKRTLLLEVEFIYGSEASCLSGSLEGSGGQRAKVGVGNLPTLFTWHQMVPVPDVTSMTPAQCPGYRCHSPFSTASLPAVNLRFPTSSTNSIQGNGGHIANRKTGSILLPLRPLRQEYETIIVLWAMWLDLYMLLPIKSLFLKN